MQLQFRAPRRGQTIAGAMVERRRRWQERADRRRSRRQAIVDCLCNALDLPPSTLGLWVKPEFPRSLRRTYLGWGEWRRPLATATFSVALLVAGIASSGEAEPPAALLSLPLALLVFTVPLALALSALLLQRKPMADALVPAYVAVSGVRHLGIGLMAQIGTWMGVDFIAWLRDSPPSTFAVSTAVIWTAWNFVLAGRFLLESYRVAVVSDHGYLMRTWLRHEILPLELFRVAARGESGRVLDALKHTPAWVWAGWTSWSRRIVGLESDMGFNRVPRVMVYAPDAGDGYVYDSSPRRFYRASMSWLRWELGQLPIEPTYQSVFLPKELCKIGELVGLSGAVVSIPGRSAIRKDDDKRFRRAFTVRPTQAPRLESVVRSECSAAIELVRSGNAEELRAHLQRSAKLLQWTVAESRTEPDGRLNIAESQGGFDTPLIVAWLTSLEPLWGELGERAATDERYAEITASLIESLGGAWRSLGGNGAKWVLDPVVWIYRAMVEGAADADRYRRCLVRVLGDVENLALSDGKFAVRGDIDEGRRVRLDAHHRLVMTLFAIAVAQRDEVGIERLAHAMAHWEDHVLGDAASTATEVYYFGSDPFRRLDSELDQIRARAHDGRIGATALVLAQPNVSEEVKEAVWNWIFLGTAPPARDDAIPDPAAALTLLDVVVAAVRLGGLSSWWHDQEWGIYATAMAPPLPMVAFRAHVGTGSKGLTSVWHGLALCVQRLGDTDAGLRRDVVRRVGAADPEDERFRSSILHLAQELQTVAAATGDGEWLNTLAEDLRAQVAHSQ